MYVLWYFLVQSFTEPVANVTETPAPESEANSAIFNLGLTLAEVSDHTHHAIHGYVL